MQILSHRGCWKSIDEKNTITAFERSFSLGFGTETDLRDRNGVLVVSHDIPSGKEITCKELFSTYSKYQNHSTMPLALNVKSDGIQELLSPLLKHFNISNYFVFDMSIPEQVAYSARGFRFFSRQSEYETAPCMVDKAQGVWLDGFEKTWFNESVIASHLEAGLSVCIVSPDLHHRPHLMFWEQLRLWSVVSHPQLLLCTDLPEEAKQFYAK